MSFRSRVLAQQQPMATPGSIKFNFKKMASPRGRPKKATPQISTVESKKYTCDRCQFTSDRLNVIAIHAKSHTSSTTTPTSTPVKTVKTPTRRCPVFTTPKSTPRKRKLPPPTVAKEEILGDWTDGDEELAPAVQPREEVKKPRTGRDFLNIFDSLLQSKQSTTTNSSSTSSTTITTTTTTIKNTTHPPPPPEERVTRDNHVEKKEVKGEEEEVTKNVNHEDIVHSIPVKENKVVVVSVPPAVEQEQPEEETKDNHVEKLEKKEVIEQTVHLDPVQNPPHGGDQTNGDEELIPAVQPQEVEEEVKKPSTERDFENISDSLLQSKQSTTINSTSSPTAITNNTTPQPPTSSVLPPPQPAVVVAPVAQEQPKEEEVTKNVNHEDIVHSIPVQEDPVVVSAPAVEQEQPEEETKDNHVARKEVIEQIVHLVPVQNPDGSVAYMFISLNDSDELKIARTEADVPPGESLETLYVEKDMDYEALMQSLTQQQVQVSSQAPSRQPPVSHQFKQMNAATAAANNLASTSQHLTQYVTETGVPVEPQQYIIDDGTQQILNTDSNAVTADGTYMNLNQLSRENNILFMTEDGNIFDPRACGVDIQQLFNQQ